MKKLNCFVVLALFFVSCKKSSSDISPSPSPHSTVQQLGAITFVPEAGNLTFWNDPYNLSVPGGSYVLFSNYSFDFKLHNEITFYGYEEFPNGDHLVCKSTLEIDADDVSFVQQTLVS